MYKLTGVTKDYQKGRATVHALQGVDLTIDDGEWLAIQGPTGHGKSTLLQMLGGLDRPTAGSVLFGDDGDDGEDLAQLRESQVTRVRAEAIGFIFQTFNLIPTLSALENVEAALVPLHVSTAERRRRAEAALADVALAARLRHLPSEPTGNLDEGTRDDIIGLLEMLWRDRGLTMVLVTHDSTVARRAQRIGIMQNGKLAIKQDTRRQPTPTA